MRCDLHVHTVHSGMCTVPGLTRVCKESYNEPRPLYERLKQRGMNLVTVTDHDSIDAVEELRRYPDFFLSEEVTCTMPSGTEMHAGVYGIEEKDHAELQLRRHDVESLLAYAVERRLFVTVNHLYSSLTGPRKEDDFAVFARDFHGVETVNGQMLARSNKLAVEFAQRFAKPVVGGSDSHTLTGLARTFTEVAGARNAQEFVAAMRRGQSVAMGESGNYFKLTADVFAIGGALIQEQPWIALGFGLFALAPLITLGNYARELAFAWYWSQKNRPRDPLGVAPEVAL
jgi:predicted metal-dependent phosphoesterase TrpH